MEKRNWDQKSGSGWMRDPKDGLWYKYKNFEKTGKTQKNVIFRNPLKAVAHEGKKIKKLYIKNQEEHKKRIQAKKDAGYVLVRGRWKKRQNFGNKDKVEVKGNNNNNLKVNKTETNNNESKNKTVVKEKTNNNESKNKTVVKEKTNNNEVKTTNNNENKNKVNKEVKKTPRFIRDKKKKGKLVSTRSVKGKQMLKVQERIRKLKEKRFGKK